MNLQDVSNLQIPDGNVRTIHDKNRRLLWGAVGYDVSFDGDMDSESDLYQLVEYIESNGTQYIKTGLVSTSAQVWRAILDMEFTVAPSSNTVMLSPSTNSWVGQGGGFYAIGGAGYRSTYSATTRQSVQVDFGATVTMTIGSETVSRNVSTDSGEFTLFSAGNKYKSSAKLYSCQMYDSTNTLVRNFRPCVRISDGTIGLYDLVGKTFYANAGTDTFSKGANIAFPTPSLPQDIYTVKGTQSVLLNGKNLASLDNGNFVISTTTISNATVAHDVSSLSIEATGTAGSQFVYWNTDDVDPNATYTFSGKAVKNTSGSAGSPFLRIMRLYSDDGETWENATTVWTEDNPVQGQVYNFSFSVSGHKYYRLRFYNNVGSTVTIGEKSTYYDFQLEKGSSATQFEAYQEKTQDINLGPIELAKVGTYQDRIYKEGEKWYIEKQVGKARRNINPNAITQNGSSGYAYQSYYGAFFVSKSDWDAQGGDYDNDIALARLSTNCGQYVAQNLAANSQANSMQDGAFCQRTGTNDRIYFRFSSLAGKTGAELKTILDAQGGADFWYILPTPTTTEITDQTLIDQLESVYDWVRRYGYTAWVQGDLPIIINRTAIP